MELVGKITQILPLMNGVSQRTGNVWALQSYVLETQEQFPKKVCFEVFGEQRIKECACQVDDIVTVSFDLESREYNGRWYTSVRAWKVVQGVATQSVIPQAAAAGTLPTAAQTGAQTGMQTGIQTGMQTGAQTGINSFDTAASMTLGEDETLPF